MNWSSEDWRSYRIGDAIRGVCVAFGGWMDWSADGKVRFLARGENGAIGVFFPEWVLAGMRENKNHIRRYVELRREEDQEIERRREASAAVMTSGRRPRR